MTLIDLDSKDVQNYTNKDGLIAISDLRMLALTDDYVNVAEMLEIIDERLEYIQEKEMDEIYRVWITVENVVMRNRIEKLRGEQE